MARLITKNKFDLEQDIVNVWDLKKDLDSFLQMYLDAPQPMDDDTVYNYIHSIACILDLRMERVWDSYCQCFELDQYASDEALALREMLLAGTSEKKKKTQKKKGDSK